ncbi:hypothetical protein [Pseudonocardia sp. HH130630-07]|uniref:hypothetical protein n=1 Tax=Pseudonocardia sp. HH130630-07 TaxID=1690815 RepID=UPI000814F807|nr:hypothetical protein [Pseudonocardia sp. HH130630-07]ANY07790.1 hypothetical protein AFB00_17485 [Pseudonocardia sp. HH130630-07]
MAAEHRAAEHRAAEHRAADSSTTDRLPRVRADKDLLRAAAERLRHNATQGAYRGLRRPELAYALASVLDMAEVRWNDQDDEDRAGIRLCCRALLDEVEGARDW